MKVLEICIALLISVPLASGLKGAYQFKLKPSLSPSLMQTSGISGTRVTEPEPYCYYSFRDRKHKRCLDGDDGSLESRSCTSGDDEIWQLIPDPTSNYYYYYRNKEHNQYISIKEGGSISMVDDILSATPLYYQTFTRSNGNKKYRIKTKDLDTSYWSEDVRMLKVKKPKNNRYKIQTTKHDDRYEKEETWQMYKQTDACE